MKVAMVLSAGVIAARRDGGEWRVLLLRAYKNWDFPKGLVEADETPLAAALREAREEASLEGLTLPWGEIFVETAPYARGKIARYYLAQARDAAVNLPVSPELGRPEHHEFRWVTLDRAVDLVAVRLTPVVGWAKEQLLARGTGNDREIT